MTTPSASLTNVSPWFFKTCSSFSYFSSDVCDIIWSIMKFKFEKHLCFIKFFIVGKFISSDVHAMENGSFKAAIRYIFGNVEKELIKVCLFCTR